MTSVTTETNPTDEVTAASAALRALAAADGGAVLAGQLARLVTVIADEAVRTKRFRTDLLAALAPERAAAAVADPDAGTDGSTSSDSRSRLNRMTKPELQRLIAQEGMDPHGTIKSRSTKGQMIDLILAFRTSSSEEVTQAPAPSAPAPSASAPDAPATDSDAPQSPASDATAAASAETPDASGPPANPPRRRRQPSVLNPYEVAASDGVQGLREQLQKLDVEQLKDIVAEYGMNNDRRAMGWTDPGRFVERIMEKTDFGATQGQAFRTGSQKSRAVQRVSAEPAQT